jgi:hypothetical protein
MRLRNKGGMAYKGFHDTNDGGNSLLHIRGHQFRVREGLSNGETA